MPIGVPLVTEYVDTIEDKRELYIQLFLEFVSDIRQLSGQERIDKRRDTMRFHICNIDTLLLFKNYTGDDDVNTLLFGIIRDKSRTNLVQLNWNSDTLDLSELKSAYEQLIELLQNHDT